MELLTLDITDAAQVRRVVAEAGNVNLVVNNAGTNQWQNLVDGDLDAIRGELDTHLFGTLSVIRGFAPVLARNGGGAVLNVLSAMSWFAYDGNNAYHVAKAAEWALTNGVRVELASQGTLVVGLHLGVADTDMTAGFEGDKLDPLVVARAGVDGIEAGAWEVLVDEWSETIKASLASDPREFYLEVPGARP